MIERELGIGDHIVSNFGYPYRIVKVTEDGYDAIKGSSLVHVSKDGLNASMETTRYEAEFHECTDVQAAIFDCLINCIDGLVSTINLMKGERK